MYDNCHAPQSAYQACINYSKSLNTIDQTNLNQRHEDKLFFENFININHENCMIKKNNITKIQISETRNIIITIKKLNNELKKLIITLESNNKLSVSNLSEIIHKYQVTKADIEKLTAKIHLSHLLGHLEKYNNRKNRVKHLNDKSRAYKINKIKEKALLDSAITAWIRDNKIAIEHEKEKKRMQQDGDIILTDIRTKRIDAKKYLGLLNEIQNLRKVQINNAKARKETLSAAADQTFSSVIGRLIDQWTELDYQYSMEEQALKVMLQSDNKTIMINQSEKNFIDWEMAIFGRELRSIFEINNLNDFVMTRFAWDKYINHDIQANPVPIGWILPQKPSSSWEKFISQ